MDLVDLNGMWPSLSDIGMGAEKLASSVADKVSKAADKVSSVTGPLGGYVSNFVGGFVGNFMTEELNNVDGAGKSQKAILSTSFWAGAGQMAVGGLCNHLSLGLDLGNDIVGKSAGYFWQGITNSLGISAGLSTYIISDYFSKSIYDNCPTGE